VTDYRNSSYVRTLDPYLHDALQDLASKIGNVAKQTGSSLTGQPSAPPAPPAALSVAVANGVLTATITASPTPGVNYSLQFSTAANFTSPITINLGQSTAYMRPATANTYYWRCYATLGASAPSIMTYYGSQAAPTAVVE
jgi:hypothetical protein